MMRNFFSQKQLKDPYVEQLENEIQRTERILSDSIEKFESARQRRDEPQILIYGSRVNNASDKLAQLQADLELFSSNTRRRSAKYRAKRKSKAKRKSR